MSIVETDKNKLIGTHGFVSLQMAAALAAIRMLDTHRVENNNLEFEVLIVDVRQIWGFMSIADTQVQVKPIAGIGFAWMSLSLVRMEG